MDSKQQLKNYFAEAIFEFRWGSQQASLDTLPSLDYKLFLGNIFNNVKDKYPITKTLNNAKVPEELANGLVQYQFRKSDSEFPLLQAGPGVFTVNENNFSSLTTFKDTVLKGLDVLYKSYPNFSSLGNFKLVLNFIYGKEFNFGSQNVNDYINSQTKLNVSIDPKLLKEAGVEEKMKTMEAKFTLNSTNPQGELLILIGKGKKEEKDALVWNISIVSEFKNITNHNNVIQPWISEAEKSLNKISEGLIK